MSLEKIATIVSSVTAFILVSIKMFFGILSGSIAVLSSAIDSLLDMFVSVFNYFAVKNAEMPADEDFNYGRGKIEPLASLFEGIIIFLSGVFILYSSINKFISKEEISYIGISIVVMIISFIITLGLVCFLKYVANKTKNIVIESDALHYQTDLLSTGGVLLSLVIIKFSGFYFIDSLIGFLIALYIMHSAISLIKKGFLMLLDVSLKDEEVQKIQQIIKSDKDINDYHYLKTRRSGKTKFVDAHIVFTPFITLLDAHNRSDKLIDEIKKIDKDYERVINFHLDPYDDSKEHNK